MKFFFTALLFSFSLNVFAQDTESANQKVTFDFDGDQMTDVVEIKDGLLVYTLSSQNNKPVQSKGMSFADVHSLSLAKNVVVLHCQFMRGENTFKFRYDSKIKAFKLIGYDNEQYGNATNDGSGSASYNLLTGDYVATWHYYDQKKEDLKTYPVINKKMSIKVYLLKDFGEEMIDEMYDIDTKNSSHLFK